MIDAVWSINANYDTVVAPIRRAYAAERKLPDPLVARPTAASEAHGQGRPQAVTQGRAAQRSALYRE